jgi:hypothetical protein
MYTITGPCEKLLVYSISSMMQKWSQYKLKNLKGRYNFGDLRKDGRILE